MATSHGGERGTRVQTLQKPKRKESKYISSDYPKELIQKEAPKDWTKAPRKEVKKNVSPSG